MKSSPYLGSAREGKAFHKAVPRFVGSTEAVTQEASAGAGTPWLGAAAFWEHCPWVVCWIFFLGTWEFYCAKGSYFSKAHDEMYHLSGKYLNISIMHNVLGDISCILHACFGRHFGHLSKQSMKHRGTIPVPARDTHRTRQSPGEQCPGQHLLLALGAAVPAGSPEVYACFRRNGLWALQPYICLPWGFVATGCFPKACWKASFSP